MPDGASIRVTRIAPPDEIGRELEQPVRNFVGAVAVRMRRLVPKRSFRLHDTIEPQEVKRVGGKVVGRVTFGGKSVRGVFVGYHLMVERGTSKMAAQPYARPALYQSRSGDLVARVVSR